MSRTFTGLFASLGFLAFGAAGAEITSYGGGAKPYGLASADMDQDGDLDLVTVSNTTAELRWLENDGNGGFTSYHVTNTSFTGGSPSAVGDVDGINGPDVVVPYYGPGRYETYLNDGTGKLTLQWQQGGLALPAYATLGEIDGDPIPDLVICEAGTAEASVHVGNGIGRFNLFAVHPLPSSPRGCVLVDLDGSGMNDLVVTSNFSAQLRVLWANVGGDWTKQSTSGVGGSPFHVAAGDLDGDMNQDVAVTCINGIYVLFGDGAGGLTTQPLLGTAERCHGIVIADMDGDTDLDIVSAAEGKDLCIWLNKGGGTFASAVRVSVVGSTGATDTVAVGDFNGDSIVDAAVAAYNDNTIYVVLNPLGLPVTWHVKAGSSGNGFSWANAMGHPQDAMDMAAPGDEIWVAGGTYVRRIVSDTVVLTMKNGVAVYGGFGGWETKRIERDPVDNVTTLHGQDVCLHVVVGASNAALDGFSVTRGNANASWPDNEGGGMLNVGVWDQTVANCTFSYNWASYGAGMYIENVSNVSVIDCTFEWNGATAYGGGMYNNTSSPQVENCVFRGNDAFNNDGGGILNAGDANPLVTNCVFDDNGAGLDGGGVANTEGARATVTNCTFYFNMAGQWGGGLSAVGAPSTATVRNSIFWANSATWAGNQIYDDVGTLQVTYSDVQDSYTGTGNINANPIFVDDSNGDFHLGECTPCIDSADGSAALPFDMDGNPRYDDQGMPNVGAGSPNYADMGAFEFQSDSPTITVLSPDGGDTWYANESWTIVWLTTGTVDWVDIQLSRDGGTSWEMIAMSQPNTGSYDWTVTGAASSACAIRVTDSTDGVPSAVSSAFRIANTAPVVSLAANPGTMGEAPFFVWFNAGSWDANGDTLAHDWDWNNDATWDLSTGAVSTASHTFDTSGVYLVWVRVSDGMDPVTDSIWITVTEPEAITVDAPNGGEVWNVDESREIKWTASGLTGNVDIWFSTDGGGSHSHIDTVPATDGSYWWTVPNQVGTNNLILIQDTDGVPSDESNGTFTISDGGSNEAPIAYNGSTNTDRDVSADCFLSYDDPDGPGAYTFDIVGWPSNGTLSGSGQNLTYTPNAGWTGTDIFAWQVYDGADWSNVATFQITVTDSGVTPPGPVWGFNVLETAETTAALEWHNPGDNDFWGVIILRRVGDWPTFTPVDGEWYDAASDCGDSYYVYSGGDEWLRDQGLSLSTQYFYVAFAYDINKNYSEAAWADGWTTGEQKPRVMEPTSPGNGEDRVRLDTEIRIPFSEAMDPGWAETAFSINPPVAHYYDYDGRSNTLVVKLLEDLQPYSWYHVTISTDAKDLYGLALEWQHDFDFRAGAYAGILGGGCGASGGVAGLLLVLALVLRRRRPAAT